MNQSPKIKILVAHHKPGYVFENDMFLPIQVGKAISNVDLGIQGDDTGDNISNLNPYYCELTAIYWAWKNLKDIDYIGLSHYRRYFDFHKQGELSYTNITINISQFHNFDFSLPPEVLSELQSGKAIVPKPNIKNISNYVDYCIFHNSIDLRKLERIISNKNNATYIRAFNEIMYDDNEIYPFNMFILSWKQFDQYCQWLFELLFEAQEEINVSDYDAYQKRVFGFMSERLFKIFLKAHDIEVCSVPVAFFSEENHIIRNNYLLYQMKRLLFRLSSRYTTVKNNIFTVPN